MDDEVLDEAIRHEALTHPEGCDCYICAAAMGDRDARAKVVDDLEYITGEPSYGDTVLN